ncbi:MAG: hypothetical protein U0610_21670 [bacterium]
MLNSEFSSPTPPDLTRRSRSIWPLIGAVPATCPIPSACWSRSPRPRASPRSRTSWRRPGPAGPSHQELRSQAREAIEGFVQEVLKLSSAQPRNPRRSPRPGNPGPDFWREGSITVYRLLFILKLESTDDPARAFPFASSSLWRKTFSPSTALAPFVRARLDEQAETGALLETGLRNLFRMFTEGLAAPEIHVAPLGGALFGPNATPLLTSPALGRPPWPTSSTGPTEPQRSGRARERVYYGPLDVEDLGRVHEALLEFEPGMATEPMCRLRRQKLEVVVPSPKVSATERLPNRLNLTSPTPTAWAEGGARRRRSR